MKRQRLIAGRRTAEWTGLTEAYSGYTRRRARPYAGGCPPSGLTEAAAARLHASNATSYAGQSNGACPTSSQNVNDNRYSCQASMCAEEAPVCGCNLLAGNTFVLFPLGVPAGGIANLAIDAGDACRWQPRSLLLVAYEADAVNPERLAAPIVQVPFLMINARVGSIPMMRRSGQNDFGAISDGFSDRKEITCVDWAPFTSVQNQGLTFTWVNIGPNPVHMFTDMWGDNLG